MRSPDLVLFIEHVAREMDVACAVKFLLQRRHGLSLEVASIWYNLAGTVEGYRSPRVVVLPSCLSVDAIGAQLRAWPRAAYVNLAYEQVFQKINLSMKAPRDDFVRRHILHLAWSQASADYMMERGVARENIAINGNPILALYQPPYSKYFGSPRETLARTHGLDSDRRWIFIPENYGAAFYSKMRLRDYVARGATEEEAYGYRDFALASLQETARWLNQAAEEGNAEIILRPRPATAETDFRQVFVDAAGPPSSRLHIIKSGTVREWIMSSDVVASSYSTTLIEAAVACRPIYMLMPLPFPDFLYNPWYDLVPKVSSFPGIMSLVDGGVSENGWHPLHEWATSTMLGGGDPVVGIADLLAATCRGEADLPDRVYQHNWPRPKPEGSLPYRAKRRLRTMVRRALTPLLGPPRDPIKKILEQDRFGQADVASRVAKWEEVLHLRTIKVSGQ